MAGFDIEINVPSPGVQTIKEVNEQLTKTAKLQADIKKGAAAPIIKGPYQALEKLQQARAAMPGNAPTAQRMDLDLALLQAIKKVQQAQTATQPAQARATAIQGPYQKRAAAQQAMQNATTPEQYHDAAIAAERAEKQIARAQPPTPKTFGQKLQTAFTSSRYDLATGNLMPLVGRSLELLGPAGPWVMGLMAGVSAAKMFAEAVSAAGSRALDFESNRLGAGGTVQQQATADVIGKSLNMTGKDITGLARQYADRLNKDPMAAIQTGDYGELGLPQNMRRVDQLGPLFKEMERIRSEPIDQATREARMTGLESLLPYRELNDTSRKIIMDAIAVHSAANADTGYGANEKAREGALRTGAQDIGDSIIKRMSGGQAALGGGNQATSAFAKHMLDHQGLGLLGPLGAAAAAGLSYLNTVAGADKKGVNAPPLPGEKGFPGSGAVSPLDANTQAVQEAGKATKENTIALDLHRKVISEGPLAAGAVPGAMRSLQPDAQKAYLQHIKTLGPFVN